jgi:activator of 2-hydroxyglutaryl-CoA dehydratase
MDVFTGRVVATGGVVAFHPTMVRLLEAELRTPVIVPPHPQEMGAFGAALAARDGAASVGPASGDRLASLAPIGAAHAP